MLNDVIVEPRMSALVCWPVEWLDNPKPSTPALHVTCAYIWDTAETSKEGILNAIRSEASGWTGDYKLANVLTPEAFGPEKNVPVLRVNTKNGTLYFAYNSIKTALTRKGIYPNTDWGFDPHVTVDLPTLLNPPERVLLRPLELWYRDDEPVVI